MPDRPLYVRPRAGNVLASATENARVRALYMQEIEDAAHAIRERWGDISEGQAYGNARGAYAAAWVATARRLGLHWPGEQARVRHHKDQMIAWVDAARTELRNFQTGTALYAWMLQGIEAVYCERHGLPLPTLEVQGTLDVEVPPPTRRARTVARNRELVGLYTSGWSQAALAAKYHLALATVKKIILEAEGHVRRPPVQP